MGGPAYETFVFEVTRWTAINLAWSERVSRCCKAFTLFHRPSLTAFAIRHCSLLTLRRTTAQSMPIHIAASSLGAPAEAVSCFPILEGSPVSSATEHLSDVGTLSPEP